MKYPISPIKERKKDGPWLLCYAEKLLQPQVSFSPCLGSYRKEG